MALTDRLPATTERVEQHTAPELNQAIRERLEGEVTRMEQATGTQLSARLRQLEREWDVERVLQANASIFSLAGLALGASVDRRFLALPAAVFGFLMQHALQGWCPPVPVFRRIGVRTMREIERERYALKAMRGDFDAVPAPGSAAPGARVRAALAAVDA